MKEAISMQNYLEIQHENVGKRSYVLRLNKNLADLCR